jgi:hypothetical protein
MARNKKPVRLVRYSLSEIKKKKGRTNWSKILHEERMEKKSELQLKELKT